MTDVQAQAWLQASRSLIDEYRHRSGAPAVAVALTDGKGTLDSLCVTHAGEIDHPLLHAPVPVGSITKTLVALAMLKSVAAARVTLDRPVAHWLPEFDHPGWCDVTIDDVLRHRAGLSIGAVATPWSRSATFFATGLPRFADLQNSFYYSNLGYEALGYVLERLYDEPLGNVLQRTICEPLGMSTAIGRMRDSDRDRIPAGHCSREDKVLHWVGDALAPAPWESFAGGAGCCAASLEDVCWLLRDLLGAKGQRGAPEWQAMLEPTESQGIGYGRGLFRERASDRDLVYHAGGMLGHRCLAMADLRSSLGVVVFTDLGGPLRGSLLLRLGRALLQAAVAPTSVRAVSYETDVDVSVVAGGYEEVGTARPERFTLSANNGMWLFTSASESAAVQWTEIDRCLTQAPTWRDFELRFERDKAGTIARAYHGSRCFVPAGRSDPSIVSSDRRRTGLAGVFQSRNPWAPFVRISGGLAGLMIHVAPLEGRLVELSERTFRVEGTPEVVRFDDALDGCPAALNLSGARYERVSSLLL